MLLVTKCFVLLKLIANANAVLKNPRSVQVALETALTFNDKDGAENVKFIDDFQNFLTKVRKTVISKNMPSRRNYEDHEPIQKERKIASITEYNLKFTDFIKELIDVLKNYQNNDLEDVFAVIDDEIRKYHYKGCKFYELVKNNNMRRLIADKLDSIKETSAKNIRSNLNEILHIIDESKFDPKKSELQDYINSLYTRNDLRKFQKILEYFRIYQIKSKRANMDLITLIRDSIRSIIFDHYSNLNANTRRDLKARLETYFWTDENRKDSIHFEWTSNYKKVTEKQPLNLREISRKPAASEENESKYEGGKQLISSNNESKNMLSKTINLDFNLENQMDIIKSGGISINAKKNRTKITTESENMSAYNIKPEIKREQHDFHVETTEKDDSDSRESTSASDELEFSNNDETKKYTINEIEDDENKLSDISSSENDAATKNKKNKITTPLSIHALSAEVGKYKKIKGFTDGIVGRSGNRKDNIKTFDSLMYSSSVIKPKKKNHKTNTKSRMLTLWEESQTTKTYHKTRNNKIAKIKDNKQKKYKISYDTNSQKSYRSEEKFKKYKFRTKTKYTTSNHNSFMFDESTEDITTESLEKYNAFKNRSNKYISRNKHHKSDISPTDKTILESTEKNFATTKLTKIFDEDTSAEIQTIARNTRRPKKAKTFLKKQLTNNYKSVKNISEDHETSNKESQIVTERNKKNPKTHTTPKSISSEEIDFTKSSTEETYDFVDKETAKKENKRNPSKNHFHNTEGISKSKYLEEKQKQYLKNRSKSANEIISPKYKKADIFISVENQAYTPIQRVKTKDTTNKVTATVFSKDPRLLTNKTKRIINDASYFEKEMRKTINNADSFVALSKFEKTSPKRLGYVGRLQLVSNSNQAYRTVETSSEVRISSAKTVTTTTTRKPNKRKDIPLLLESDKTGIISNNFISRVIHSHDNADSYIKLSKSEETPQEDLDNVAIPAYLVSKSKQGRRTVETSTKVFTSPDKTVAIITNTRQAYKPREPLLIEADKTGIISNNFYSRVLHTHDNADGYIKLSKSEETPQLVLDNNAIPVNLVTKSKQGRRTVETSTETLSSTDKTTAIPTTTTLQAYKSKEPLLIEAGKTGVISNKMLSKAFHTHDNADSSIKLSQSEERSQEALDNVAIPEHSIISKSKQVRRIVETSTEALTSTDKTVAITNTIRKPYKPNDILLLKTDNIAVINNTFFSTMLHTYDNILSKDIDDNADSFIKLSKSKDTSQELQNNVTIPVHPVSKSKQGRRTIETSTTALSSTNKTIAITTYTRKAYKPREHLRKEADKIRIRSNKIFSRAVYKHDNMLPQDLNNNPDSSIKLSKSEETSQEALDNVAIPVHNRTSKSKQVHRIVETSTKALTSTEKTVATAITTRKLHKSRDIPLLIEADKTGIIHNTFFSRALHTHDNILSNKTINSGDSSIKLSKSKEIFQEKLENVAIPVHLDSKSKQVGEIVETSIEALPSKNKIVARTTTIRQSYKPKDIHLLIQADKIKNINDKFSSRALHAQDKILSNTPMFNERNIKPFVGKYVDNIKKTTTSHLQLIDLVERHTKKAYMTSNLNTTKETSDSNIEQTKSRYMSSNFWQRPRDKVKFITANITKRNEMPYRRKYPYEITKTTNSYLKLIDLVENNATFTINLDANTKTLEENINQTNQMPADFWSRSRDSVNLTTANVTELNNNISKPRSFLKLVDLVERNSKMTINLDAITQTLDDNIERTNHTNIKYSDIRFRSMDKTTIRTTNAENTDFKTTISNTNAAFEITTKNLVEMNNIKRPRKKKKKRKRMSTNINTTNTTLTTTVATTTHRPTTTTTIISHLIKPMTSATTTFTTTKTIPTTITTIVPTTTSTTSKISTDNINKIPTTAINYRRTQNETETSKKTTNVEIATISTRATNTLNKIYDDYNYDNNTAYYENMTDGLRELIDRFEMDPGPKDGIRKISGKLDENLKLKDEIPDEMDREIQDSTTSKPDNGSLFTDAFDEELLGMGLL